MGRHTDADRPLSPLEFDRAAGDRQSLLARLQTLNVLAAIRDGVIFDARARELLERTGCSGAED